MLNVFVGACLLATAFSKKFIQPLAVSSTRASYDTNRGPCHYLDMPTREQFADITLTFNGFNINMLQQNGETWNEIQTQPGTNVLVFETFYPFQSTLRTCVEHIF